MDKHLNDIIIGCILGDAYISKNGSIQIEHSEKQKNYVFWKYEQFGTFAGKPPKRIVRRHRKTGQESVSFRFYTKCKFKDYRLLFYPENRKIIPKNIDQYLSSNLSLAIWFMDDGGKGGNTPYGTIISVAGFSVEDQQLLKECLKNNYGLNVTVWKNGQLYIPKKDYALFYDAISPLILPDFRYKLSITP